MQSIFELKRYIWCSCGYGCYGMRTSVVVKERLPEERFLSVPSTSCRSAYFYKLLLFTGQTFQAYSNCQKNVPIAEHFFCYNTYAAILYPEHYYDNWYKLNSKFILEPAQYVVYTY
jgi:hypothetical protein